MKIHYLEAKQNKEREKLHFAKGKTCEFSQCIITYMEIHGLEKKPNKEEKYFISQRGKPVNFHNVYHLHENTLLGSKAK
jgi:hypothetical protein